MLMTEEQATATWCPMVRIGAYTDSGLGVVTVNRDPRPDVSDDCNCIGAKCAAWRWRDAAPSNCTSNKQRRGYCGIAVRPEVE